MMMDCWSLFWVLVLLAWLVGSACVESMAGLIVDLGRNMRSHSLRGKSSSSLSSSDSRYTHIKLIQKNSFEKQKESKIPVLPAACFLSCLSPLTNNTLADSVHPVSSYHTSFSSTPFIIHHPSKDRPSSFHSFHSVLAIEKVVPAASLQRNGPPGVCVLF